MKKHIVILVCLILLSCGNNDSSNEILEVSDPIIGVWQEVLDDSNQYDDIVWTFDSLGTLSINFDGTIIEDGSWSAISGSPNSYSLRFQQYPDAAERLFFVDLNFSKNKNSVVIMGESSTFHWTGNRSLVKN
jgi:hypothetical protein